MGVLLPMLELLEHAGETGLRDLRRLLDNTLPGLLRRENG